MYKNADKHNQNNVEHKTELKNVCIADNNACGEVFRAGEKPPSTEMQDEKMYGEAMLKSMYMFFANTYALIGVRSEYAGYHLLLDIQRYYSTWQIRDINRCEELTSNKAGVSINTLIACIEDCLDKEVVSLAMGKVLKHVLNREKFEVKEYFDIVHAVDELFVHYFSTIVQ